jgi:hypothetical protein
MKNLIRNPTELRNVLLKTRFHLEQINDTEYVDQFGTIHNVSEIKEELDRVDEDFQRINKKTDFSKPFILCHSINWDWSDGELIFDIVKPEDFAS